MLDLNKLPTEPRNAKAVWWHGDLRFGMMHTECQAFADKSPRSLERNHPEVVESVMKKYRANLADGCEVDVDWMSDDYSVAAFVGYRLVVPHGLEIMRRGDDIPQEIGYLLSGNLQLGEAFSYRNFKNYRQARNLKYLPFVITPESFVFNVYLPTTERIQEAAFTFGGMLTQLAPLKPSIASVVRDIHALVVLDQIRDVSSHVEDACQEIQARLDQALRPYTKKFGYVYQGLPGPQDVVRFYYEMFAAKQE